MTGGDVFIGLAKVLIKIVNAGEVPVRGRLEQHPTGLPTKKKNAHFDPTRGQVQDQCTLE